MLSKINGLKIGKLKKTWSQNLITAIMGARLCKKGIIKK
jgi:hypothetical protein